MFGSLSTSFLVGVTSLVSVGQAQIRGRQACDEACDRIPAASCPAGPATDMTPPSYAPAPIVPAPGMPAPSAPAPVEPSPFAPSPQAPSVPSTPSPSFPESFSGPGSSVGSSGGSGGFGGLDLIPGSTPGESFAALAPGSYLDNPVLSNMFRFRFDAGYNNTLPDRAEYFYAQCGCFNNNTGPGPIRPERSVDYQELMPYFERVLSRNLSFFVETPIRLINPDINDNTGGMGDLNVGFKRAIIADGTDFLTAQLRVYAPTGDTDRGLGNGHATIEPGILHLGRYSDRTVVQSEFRVWIPISDSQVGGQNFAGTILRYGLGGGYDLLNMDSCSKRRRLTGTLEAAGWTILEGLALDPNQVGIASLGGAIDVSGDTIVNIKPGLRYVSGQHSIAGAYGVPVTGDRWYSDVFRLEYRYAY
jgi:hypothetical protein